MASRVLESDHIYRVCSGRWSVGLGEVLTVDSFELGERFFAWRHSVYMMDGSNDRGTERGAGRWKSGGSGGGREADVLCGTVGHAEKRQRRAAHATQVLDQR